MARVDERPFPPGDYGVVVVGSGPGGLQTAHDLARLGISHAVLSRDEVAGGMFQHFPIFERLISWTKPDAPVERDSREYERYDHNSLLADEPAARALVPQFMDRSFDVPSRTEMEQALAAYSERARVTVRFGCEWQATRRLDDGRLALETSDGEYRCRAAVFALGVTAPWKPAVPGVEQAPHYVETRPASEYRGRRVGIVGKRNSAFEVANGLLPWAKEVVLLSPRPVETAALARSPLRTRYLQPYDEYVRGVAGAYVLDASIERVERWDGGYRIVAQGTTRPGPLRIEADDVVIATGFQTPLRDLPELGVATVADGRIPAQTAFFESVSAPGVYFAGNASQGAPGLLKHGLSPSSSAVNGFRYNARVLVGHIAGRHFDHEPARPPIDPDDAVDWVLRELSRSPELWVQKGYLARVLTFNSDRGIRDEGVVPLAHFVDAGGDDAAALTIELDADAAIVPVVYVRRRGEVSEHPLWPHPLFHYDGDEYRRETEMLLRPLL